MTGSLKPVLVFTAMLMAAAPARAEICAATDAGCLRDMIVRIAPAIDNNAWRDQTYRDTARIMATHGQGMDVIELVARIENPDTKAMAIRAIGMESAKLGWDQDRYSALFTALMAQAQEIDHPPSHAIALTYIAMAQAFAADDQGAMQTIALMENDALRDKAYAETAEIQAERHDWPAARESVRQIGNPAFINRALRSVADILARNGAYENALEAAISIENPYQKAQSVLHILAAQARAPEGNE